MLFASISPRLTENNQNLFDNLLAHDYVSSSNKFPLEFRAWQHALFFAHNQRLSVENAGLALFYIFCAGIQQALVFIATM